MPHTHTQCAADFFCIFVLLRPFVRRHLSKNFVTRRQKIPLLSLHASISPPFLPPSFSNGLADRGKRRRWEHKIFRGRDLITPPLSSAATAGGGEGKEGREGHGYTFSLSLSDKKPTTSVSCSVRKKKKKAEKRGGDNYEEAFRRSHKSPPHPRSYDTKKKKKQYSLYIVVARYIPPRLPAWEKKEVIGFLIREKGSPLKLSF